MLERSKRQKLGYFGINIASRVKNTYYIEIENLTSRFKDPPLDPKTFGLVYFCVK